MEITDVKVPQDGQIQYDDYVLQIFAKIESILNCWAVSRGNDIGYDKYERLAMSFVMRWAVQIAAIKTLCLAHLDGATGVNLRAAFEVYLQFMYYLSDEKDIDRKYVAYNAVVCDKKLNVIEGYIKETNGNNSVLEKLSLQKKVIINRLRCLDVKKYGFQINYCSKWFRVCDNNIVSISKLAKFLTDNGYDNKASAVFSSCYDVLSQFGHGFDVTDELVFDGLVFKQRTYSENRKISVVVNIIYYMLTEISKILNLRYCAKDGNKYIISENDIVQLQHLYQCVLNLEN